MAIKRTLLDTVQPASRDPLQGMEEARRRLRAYIVDVAVADETQRRELLDLLKTLGSGKRGRVSSGSRLAYVNALSEAGFTKQEIIEIIERLYNVSERQIERDLKSLTAKKQ